jgi:hypothetical protein
VKNTNIEARRRHKPKLIAKSIVSHPHLDFSSATLGMAC